MFRAYGSFPNGGTETSSVRNPLENIQTWGSPNPPPPTPTPSTTSSSSPDFNSSQTQANANSQRHNNSIRQHHLQQSQFQNNLHAHQQNQQQQKSQPFYIEAMNNINSPNNGHKSNDIKGKNTFSTKLLSIRFHPLAEISLRPRYCPPLSHSLMLQRQRN